MRTVAPKARPGAGEPSWEVGRYSRGMRARSAVLKSIEVDPDAALAGK
jgi:hypothetical protein